MKKLARTAIVLASASLLGACQGPILKGWGFAKKKPEAAAPAPELAAADSIARGRDMLKAGHISAAVAEFRVARLDADYAAPANNGLGVAYAKLGRMDLAERYFRLAIALDPADDRYAANLIRLRHQGTLLARKARAAEEAKFVAAEPTAKREVAASQSGKRPGVVHIVTRPELGNAPRMTVAAREDKQPVETEAAKPTVEAVAEVEQDESARAKTVAVKTGSLPAPLSVSFRR